MGQGEAETPSPPQWGEVERTGTGRWKIEASCGCEVFYWYGKKPQFTRVVIRKVPQNANRVAAIQSGAAEHSHQQGFSNRAAAQPAHVEGVFAGSQQAVFEV